MKLGGPARFFVEVHNAEELIAVHRNATSKNLPIFILGGGSNVIAKDEGFGGLIIRMRIMGFEIINDDINTTTIKNLRFVSKIRIKFGFNLLGYG